jgi:hypothetical protein
MLTVSMRFAPLPFFPMREALYLDRLPLLLHYSTRHLAMVELCAA